MTWNEFVVARENGAGIDSIESQVLGRLGGRLQEFHLDEVGEQLILRGVACSYHVKQLAQHEVMGLTRKPILSNQIRVA